MQFISNLLSGMFLVLMAFIIGVYYLMFFLNRKAPEETAKGKKAVGEWLGNNLLDRFK